MSINRRSLIAGAGFATAAPSLVRAETLLEIPGDPLTSRGLLAAQRWAADGFGELPACRLAFADGQTTRWFAYNCASRKSIDPGEQRTYAVAIEVVTTDAAGRRFITSVPVDGVKITRDLATQAERQRSLWAQRATPGLRERWQLVADMVEVMSDEPPF